MKTKSWGAEAGSVAWLHNGQGREGRVTEGDRAGGEMRKQWEGKENRQPGQEQEFEDEKENQ